MAAAFRCDCPACAGLAEAAEPSSDGAAGGYGPNGKPSFDTSDAASQLLRHGGAWASSGGTTRLTYGFRGEAPATMPEETTGFRAFSDGQIAAATLALQAWADVANLQFVRESGYGETATLRFASYTGGAEGASAFGFLPSGSGNRASVSLQGDVWTNAALWYNAAPSPGNYGSSTLVHEVGHALGLLHPGEYDALDEARPTYENSAAYFEDSRQYSIMSYWSEGKTGAAFRGGLAASPMLHDIAAAQRLYGPNLNAFLGDTVYGFNSNTDRPWFSVATGGRPVFAVWDAGGTDTLDFSGFAQNQFVTLEEGRFSDVGGLLGNVAIAFGAVIENARGGGGSDRLVGNAFSNGLFGGEGRDSLSGLAGADFLVGEGGDDVMLGGDGDDLLGGHGGSDTGHGEAGRDRLYGDEGNDTLWGGVDSDQVFGQSGDDLLVGEAGDDAVFGGDGDDLLGGHAGADTLRGEAGRDLLYGDEDGDTLLGGADADRLFGQAGDDFLVGEGGDDSVFGGEGQDLLGGHAGADSLHGEAGRDRLYGDEGDDVLLGGADADAMFGQPGDDFLVGEGGDDTVFGGEGADLLGGHAGADILIGEAGADRLYGDEGDDRLVGGAGADLIWGQAGADVFVFGALSDSTGGDPDRVMDYARAQGDLIDLSGIDAVASTAADEAFVFAGAFSRVAGQATLTAAPEGTLLQLDVNGDAVADFALLIVGPVDAGQGWIL